MKLRSILSTLALSLIPLAACGPAPLEATVDNTPMRFNQGITWESTESQGTWRFTITGDADPVANAVDDEYRLTVRIDLDDAMLATAPRGVPLVVHGSTHFNDVSPAPSTPDGGIQWAYEAASDQSPFVRGISTTAACFCGRGGNETQSYTGTITLEDAEPGALRVRFDLALDGQIPFRTPAGVTSHAVLRGVGSAPLHP